MTNNSDSTGQDVRQIPALLRKGRCKHCGLQVLVGQTPCPHCGHELKWAQAVVQNRKEGRKLETPAFDLLTRGNVDSMQPTKQQSNNPENDRETQIRGFDWAMSFSGRARRSTYWGTLIFLVVTAGILGGICGGIAGRAFSYGGIEDGLRELDGMIVPVLVSSVLLVLCGWAVQVRRCHDLGWSGWLAFVMFAVGFIPFVGWIGSLIFFICLGVMDGQPFTNQYGPDPKGRNMSDEHSRQPAVPQPQQSATVPTSQQSATVPTSLGDRLRELKNLLDEGLLTQEEFNVQKAKILNDQKP